MADLYITDNDDGSFLTFNKRVVYNYDIFDSTTAFENVDFSDPEYGNLTDFNFGEKFLYGRVTRDFIPIFLDSQSKARLKPLNSTSIDEPTRS